MGFYRRSVMGLGLLWLISGCTNQQLRVSTTRQARTLTETQYEQVLNNLAMYAVDPSALPSMISLRTGSTQIGDTGSLGFLGVAGVDTKFGASPTISGSRSIVDQWGNAPISDDDELTILRKAFRMARGIPSLLNAAEANDLGHDLSQQIGTTSDISTTEINLQRLFDLKAGAHGSRTGINLLNRLSPPDEKTFSDASDSFNRTVNTLDDVFLIDDVRNPPNFKITFDGGLPSSALTQETKRRINDIQGELVKIGSLGNTWYHVGCKRDVPPNACYVGRARGCGRTCGHRLCGDECYVWVCPDGRAALADFTLSILKLSGVFKDAQVVTVPSGIQYSPTFSGGGR